MTYVCGRCGSTVLRLTCNPDGNGWDVHCGNGHPLAPIPGFEIMLDVAPRQADRAQGDDL